MAKWIIQWTGRNGRSNWRKAYPIEFGTKAAAIDYMAKMGLTGNDRFRTREVQL